ncbi:MAG: 3' terminal RNA ribose 2'-O-methyltransferase Hen1 [Planctomycetota bacterium]
MLLTITNHSPQAADLGYLLHKHPDKVQAFSLSYGQAHVFYPECSAGRCTACLLLDIDPVGLVRNRRGPSGEGRSLEQYVNDRPYVASSFLSVALTKVYGSALAGRCTDKPDLVDSPLDLTIKIDVVPCRGAGDGQVICDLFKPLGYEVETIRHSLDEKFPQWGEGPYFSVTLRAKKPLAEVLTHLYVLLPVLDNDKHYWVDKDEVEKLLKRGEGWLPNHPAKEMIANRYLRHQRSLTRDALARLTADEQVDPDADAESHDEQEEAIERPMSLNDQRHAAVIAALKASGAKRVLDLGCAQGKLLRRLFDEKQFDLVTGMDVSLRALESAERRLRLERMPDRQRDRIQLLHGSLMYRDQRLAGYDAACLVEVIEHLDPPRLAAMERAVFEFAKPLTVVVTTPNVEYNVRFETLPAGQLRHRDHRFEWTRDEFQSWATALAERFGYAVRFLPVGDADVEVGSPTQMGVFECQT